MKKHFLAVARRHFEDAKWGVPTAGPLELVVRSVAITWLPGPSYQVQVVVDRAKEGRRLGQATGTGSAQADRTRDRTRAAWAPGPWGAAAMNAANKARPAEDAPIIETATLRAVDSALLQLSAVWAGEQQVEAMQKNMKKR